MSRQAKRKRPGAKAKAGSLPAFVLRLAFGVALAVGIVYAVAWLGSRAGERVADRDRYAVRVADIACDAPPGTDRAAFLSEVRYLSGLPEAVQAVDPGLSDKLSAAFLKHPWVAEVAGVRVDADGTVRVDLRFRVPVLAVAVRGESEPRAVDRSGVLLPSVPNAGSLPLLVTAVPRPTKPAGQVWDDPTVKRAAELATEYRLRRVEKTDKGWRLTRDDGKVLVVSW